MLNLTYLCQPTRSARAIFLVGMQDALGRSATLSYDSSGHLAQWRFLQQLPSDAQWALRDTIRKFGISMGR